MPVQWVIPMPPAYRMATSISARTAKLRIRSALSKNASSREMAWRPARQRRPFRSRHTRWFSRWTARCAAGLPTEVDRRLRRVATRRVPWPGLEGTRTALAEREGLAGMHETRLPRAGISLHRTPHAGRSLPKGRSISCVLRLVERPCSARPAIGAAPEGGCSRARRAGRCNRYAGLGAGGAPAAVGRQPEAACAVCRCAFASLARRRLHHRCRHSR